ncbi:MAG: HAMP domain-containing sensor histidine kinase, partial [Clostridiaceae bacterium]
MNKYFINYELKISSLMLLCTMTVCLLFTCFLLKLYHQNLKDDYIKSLGAITERITEKNPELKDEIVPLITKEISEEEALKGKTLLNEYGLNEKLENVLFPYMNSTVKKNNFSVILIFVFMTLILFGLNYTQYAFFYNKIRRLTFAAKRVIEGEYDISINENKEGDFSKLAVSFNSMREIIRNNLTELKKEKQFLVNLMADISHQLKTPISSMTVYNDIMLEKEISKEQREVFLLKNQNQLNRMTWLIKSLLKLAKLDAKAIEFNKEKQSLNETMQDSIDALESKAMEKNINIIFDEREQIVFPHDTLWLQESFINIIKNCIEHTPSGGKINIKLSENPVYRRIIIEDTGEGISEEDLPHIFKRFYKAKNSSSDSVGIGLALAKSIVESHGGIIEAESCRGKGARFIITF